MAPVFSPRPNLSRRALKASLLVTVVAGLLPAGVAAQSERRGRQEPGLILETGGLTGTCDVLKFTADGKHLLAAGDDKVVHVWHVTDKVLEAEPVLRWSTWREQRGQIHAMALSHDPKNQLVAIGGVGIRTDSVVVLDRFTGQPVKALTSPKSKEGANYAVWAMGFSPSARYLAYGTGDGTVWLWDLKSNQENDVRRLGPEPAGNGKGAVNRVRLVTFLSELQLATVAVDGQVLEWNVAAPQAAPRRLFQFDRTQKLFCVVASPRHGGARWVAASGEENARTIEVRSLPDGRQVRTVTLPERSVPQSLAFDARGERLAVGTKLIAPGAAFAKEIQGEVFLCDLKDEHPRPTPGPHVKLYAEALAFAPDGNHLAIADSHNYEVSLWKLPAGDKPVAKAQGVGRTLWEVALSHDGHVVGFLDDRSADPGSPNHRGKGDLRRGDGRFFDLQKRTWGHGKGFQAVEPVETMGGWKVEPDTRDAYVWHVVGPDQQRHTLPLDPTQDVMPRCYTFLKNGSQKGVRLAVGHLWGVSVFELVSGKEPRRVRVFTGHQGEVMSVAPSADHKLLVTASRDQTIAFWSLAEWQYQGELGARFIQKDGKIQVSKVELGSPAWEAGLIEGDEIVVFAFAAKLLYNRAPKYGKTVGTPEECLARLVQPEPGKEFYFGYKRGGKDTLHETLTTVRQRPLWRFFPTRDGEWVMWRWRDYYYDMSANGDQYIGWQVSADVNVKPDFYHADQMRKQFYNPQKVADVVGGALRDAEKVLLPDIEPPKVSIQASAKQVKDAGVTLTLEAHPLDVSKNGQKLEHVVLLVNQFQVPAPFVGRALAVDAAGAFRPPPVAIPKEMLRRGPNTITWICYNNAGGKAEAREEVDYTSDQAVQSNLYGLVVGINNYKNVKGIIAGDLNCCKQDAQSMREAWMGQKGTQLYKDVDIKQLMDEQATRDNILKEIAALAKKVKPDDWVVLFFAGHGMADEVGGRDSQQVKPGTFVFICPNFDAKQRAKTGVTANDLHAALGELNCKKLLLVDACHSGDLPMNPLPDLHRGETVAIIVAACEPYQESQENAALHHGLFTLAVLDCLQARFADADLNKDGYVDSRELVAFVEKRVKELSRPEDQHPRYSPTAMAHTPLAQKKK